MNTKTELLPCPFCGGVDFWVKQASESGQGSDYGQVVCHGCLATCSLALLDKPAMLAWNTRVYPAEIQAAIDRDTPKKPVSRPMGWIDFNADHCPNCDTQLHEYTDKNVTFCYSCGQRLDWSE